MHRQSIKKLRAIVEDECLNVRLTKKLTFRSRSLTELVVQPQSVSTFRISLWLKTHSKDSYMYISHVGSTRWAKSGKPQPTPTCGW